MAELSLTELKGAEQAIGAMLYHPAAPWVLSPDDMDAALAEIRRLMAGKAV